MEEEGGLGLVYGFLGLSDGGEIVGFYFDFLELGGLGLLCF